MNLHFFKGLSVLSASQRGSISSTTIERNVPKHARYIETHETSTNAPLVIYSEAVQRTAKRTVVNISTVRDVAVKTTSSHFCLEFKRKPVPYVEEMVADGPPIVHTPAIGRRLVRGKFRRSDAAFAAQAESHYCRMQRRQAFLEAHGRAEPSHRPNRVAGEARVAKAIAATGRVQVVRFLDVAKEIGSQRGVHNNVGGAPPGASMKAEAAALREDEKRHFKQDKPWLGAATKTTGKKALFLGTEVTPAQLVQLAGSCRAEPHNTNTPADFVTGNSSLLAINGPNTCGPDALATLLLKNQPVHGPEVEQLRASYAKNRLHNGMTCMYGLALCASSVRMPTVIVGERSVIVYTSEGENKPTTVMSVVMHSNVANNVLNRPSPASHWYAYGYTTFGELERACGSKWANMAFDFMCQQVWMERDAGKAAEDAAQRAAAERAVAAGVKAASVPTVATVAMKQAACDSTDPKYEKAAKPSDKRAAVEVEDEGVMVEGEWEFARDRAAYQEVVRWANNFERRSRGVVQRTIGSQVERSTSQVDNGHPPNSPPSDDGRKADLPSPAPVVEQSPSPAAEPPTVPARRTSFGDKTTHIISPNLSEDSGSISTDVAESVLSDADDKKATAHAQALAHLAMFSSARGIWDECGFTAPVLPLDPVYKPVRFSVIANTGLEPIGPKPAVATPLQAETTAAVAAAIVAAVAAPAKRKPKACYGPDVEARVSKMRYVALAMPDGTMLPPPHDVTLDASMFDTSSTGMGSGVVDWTNFKGKGGAGRAPDDGCARCLCNSDRTCPRCGDPSCEQCSVFRTGFAYCHRRKSILDRIFGTGDYVCYNCARDMKKRKRRLANSVGGVADPFPLLCAPSTITAGYIIVPRLEEASYGRSGTNPFAMGETSKDGARYCWYSTDGVQRTSISPRGMFGWHLAYEAGIFQVYVNTPVSAVVGTPFPMDVTGIVTYRGIVKHHTVYLESSVIQPFVLQLQSQPPTAEGYGISLNSQFRAVSAALAPVNWLALHPMLATETTSSLPGSVLSHVYSRVTPAAWNFRTSIFKLKLFLSSGRLFALVEEFGCQAVLAFVWGVYATGLGIPFTKAFSDAFSGMATETLDAPAWLKILVAISCGPYGFIMCLCTSFLKMKPPIKVLVGAILTTIVVAAVPFLSIPAIVAAIFAKWAAVSMGMMATGALYTVGKFMWDNRLFISRNSRKSFGTTLYPVQPYGTTQAQNMVGGTRDDGCIKAVCTHDLTPIERTVGHLERGYKVHAFIDLKPEISDHYANADSSFSDAVQMRLTKKRASPVQVTHAGSKHKLSIMGQVEWNFKKKAADRAEQYLDGVCKQGREAWDRRFEEFDAVYGRGLLDTVLHADFPKTQLTKGAYNLNPLFYQWWLHLDSSKRRIYENEVRRLDGEVCRSAPHPSSVYAKANVKIEIMPFLTALKSLKPRIIQYMPPEFMVHVAPQCWAYGECMKASTGPFVCITSGYSVDEYSDKINDRLKRMNGQKRFWFMAANGDDNAMMTNWISDADSARLYKNVVDAYKFHGRDVTCHVKRTIIDGAYCSSTFIPVSSNDPDRPGHVYYRHYMLPFKQAYKAFTFILSREFQYIARTKMGAEQFGNAILKAAADASVSRYFMFRGDPFMEPVMLAMMKRCGRGYVANWDGVQAKAWQDKHQEHSYGWTAGLRVYARNEVDDALIWDAHEYRTGIPRASLIALRDELVEIVENNQAQQLVRLQNMATFVEGLSVEQGLKTLSTFRKRPDWIGHGDCLFVESDNGSYDASTTMYTHKRMIRMQRDVAGDSNFVDYNDVRRRCKVRLQCERGFGSWVIVGQMMSGWPDTTISNSFANIWEMVTALELHGGFVY